MLYAQWEANPSTYNVGYAFVSDDGKSLPAAVLALLPSDDTDYADGSEVTTADLSGAEVVTAGGKWTFVEWDEDTKTIAGDNVIFTGTWTFTENEPDALTYNVGYTFVSDDGKSLPAPAALRRPATTAESGCGLPC